MSCSKDCILFALHSLNKAPAPIGLYLISSLQYCYNCRMEYIKLINKIMFLVHSVLLTLNTCVYLKIKTTFLVKYNLNLVKLKRSIYSVFYLFKLFFIYVYIRVSVLLVNLCTSSTTGYHREGSLQTHMTVCQGQKVSQNIKYFS